MSFPALTASTTIFRCQWSGTAATMQSMLLVVEQLLVAARGPQLGAHDLPREGVAAVVEVAGGGAFDAGQARSRCEQAGALHPDADHPEAHAIAGGAPAEACPRQAGPPDGRFSEAMAAPAAAGARLRRKPAANGKNSPAALMLPPLTRPRYR